MVNYDLLTEPWIPVITTNGERKRIGLIALFEQAQDIKEISHYNPLVIASVYRLCLAILFRVWDSGKTKEYQQKFLQGQFEPSLFDYLTSEHCQGRFNLFDSERPFFQTPGFTKDAVSSVKKMSPQFATGNNKTLFCHMHDGDDFALSADEAALNLLVCQYFSLGGGISGSSVQYGKHPNFTNSLLIGGAVFYMTGENIYQTLILNLNPPKEASFENNLPIWELDNPASLQQPAMQGISHYLTWPSRHIRLLPDESGNVAKVYLSQGYSAPQEILHEPYFCMRVKNDGKGLVPVRLSFERAFWRDSMSILGFAAADDSRDFKASFAAGIDNTRQISKQLLRNGIKQLSCQVIALDNNKANPLCWFNEKMPVYLRYVQEDYVLQSEGTNFLKKLHIAIQQAELMAGYLKKATRNFAANLLMEGSRAEDISKVVSALNPDQHYWPHLENHFYKLYRGLAEVDKNDLDAISKLCTTWKIHIIDIAQDALLKATEPMRNGTGRSLRAFAYGQRNLNNSISEFWGKDYHSTKDCKMNKPTQTTIDVVDLLIEFQSKPETHRAAMAQLRRCLIENPADLVKAYRYLNGTFANVSDSWQSRIYCLCVALFAIQKKHKTSFEKYPVNLGSSLRKLKYTEDYGDSFDDRFELLLQAEPEQLPIVLRSFFQMLARTDITVDYARLITDLLNWNSPDKHTQIQWARSFWAPAPKDDSDPTNSKTTETDKTEIAN